jgi:hypothetical protein
MLHRLQREQGDKDLAVWLESKYCRTRGITAESVAVGFRQAEAGDAFS